MGYNFAQDLAGWLQKDLALRVHLQCNHYPPVSLDFKEACYIAIGKVMEEHYDTEIELPNGKIRTAREVVEGLHLESFVELWSAEYEEEEEFEDG